MADAANEELDITVRAFTVRARPIALRHPRASAKPPPLRRYPQEALVWDPETETAPPQRHTFSFWRLYRDRPDGEAGRTSPMRMSSRSGTLQALLSSGRTSRPTRARSQRVSPHA